MVQSKVITAEPLAVDVEAAAELVALVGGAPAKIRKAIAKPGEYTATRFARPLLDVLRAARVAVELDWRSEPEELTTALIPLARKVKFPRALTTAFRATVMDKALRELGRAMANARWALVQIDLESDSHGFFVVPARKLARVKKLLRALRVRTL